MGIKPSPPRWPSEAAMWLEYWQLRAEKLLVEVEPLIMAIANREAQLVKEMRDAQEIP